MRTRLTPTLVALMATLSLVMGLVTPVLAQEATPTPEPEVTATNERGRIAVETLKAIRKGVVVVRHGPVEMTLVDSDSDGHQLGDIRVASVATTTRGADPLGRLDATLTTTSTDVPAPGDETRIGVFVFTFGDRGLHQVTVQGSAHYPAQAPTIESGETTIWPIVGGSGVFAGVAGSAVTRHLRDGSWVHTLRLHKSRADALVERAFKERVRTGLREWRDDRQDVRSERQAARQEARVERQEARASSKADRDELKAELKADRADRKAELKADRADRKAARKAERDELKAERQSDADPETATVAIDHRYTEAAADEGGVVRTDLGLAEPASAPGQELGLWHYAIAAGEELAPHTHPGWQLARITDGELEYTVLEGEGVLLRSDGSSEAMGPGTYLLATGDGVIENPGLVHLGANRSDETMSIITATLFEAGEPIASVVEGSGE